MRDEPDEVRPADALVRSRELQDLAERLDRARSRSSRHLLWAWLGVTPVALVPLVGLLLEGSLGLAVAMSAGVAAVELWRYGRAQREVRDLERVAQALADRKREDEPGDRSGRAD